jgi:hypothetical protein
VEPGSFLRVEVRYVVRAADLERDDVVDLERASVRARRESILDLDLDLMPLRTDT